MSSNSRSSYVKIQKCYYPQLFSWYTILFAKKPTQYKYSMSSLQRADLQTVPEKIPGKDHVWFFEELIPFTCQQMSSHFIQRSAWSKDEIQRQYFTFCLLRRIQFFHSRSLTCLKKLILLPQQLLVNLWQTMYCHFSGDSYNRPQSKITAFWFYFKIMLS